MGWSLWWEKNTTGVAQLSKSQNLLKTHSNMACPKASCDHSTLRLTQHFPFTCICLSSLGLRDPEIHEWSETMLYCGLRWKHSANLPGLNEPWRGSLSQGKGSINTARELSLCAQLEKVEPQNPTPSFPTHHVPSRKRASVLKEFSVHLDYTAFWESIWSALLRQSLIYYWQCEDILPLKWGVVNFTG